MAVPHSYLSPLLKTQFCQSSSSNSFYPSMISLQSCNALGLQLHLGVVIPLLFQKQGGYWHIHIKLYYWVLHTGEKLHMQGTIPPFGTLKFSGLDVEYEPFTLTLQFPGCRYESKHYKAVPPTPNCLFRTSSSIP